MSITLNGLANSVVPVIPGQSTAPFQNLSFSNLVGATDYTLTVTLSDGTGDFDLFNVTNGDDEISTLTIATTGASLAGELQSVEFDVDNAWGVDGTPSSVTLTFALTSPSSVALGSEQVFCLAAGTCILTPRGETPIEALREGDRVVTAHDDGRLAPVRWVGRRRVWPARHARPWDVNPIRVRAGALGPGRPSRDLLLSPDHALFIDSMLVRARDLLNGATVVQEDSSEITYFHVELDRHDLLLAEGTPVESFLDTGNRGTFENGGALMPVDPDFARAVWARDAFAPLVWQGPALAAVRARLAARAGQIGWALSDQPDLHLTADGHCIRPLPQGAALVFQLPAGTETVHLRSRSAVPAYVLADSFDTRALGVAVTWLARDGVPLELGSAALGDGWLAPESGLRWTDGAATLRVDGARRLELRTASLLRYWIAPDSAPAMPERRAA